MTLHHAPTKLLSAVLALGLAGCTSVLVEQSPTGTGGATSTPDAPDAGGTGGAPSACPTGVVRGMPSTLWAVGLHAHPTGDFVMTGSHGGPLDLGNGQSLAGSSGVLLARFGADGEAHALTLLDESKIGLTDVGESATDATGSLTLLGPAASDSVWVEAVTKLDPAGEPAWTRALPPLADWHADGPWALAQTGDGGTLVASNFQGQVDFGAGLLVGPYLGSHELDCFVVKLEGGATAFSRQLGSSSFCVVSAVAGDAAGDTLLTGTFDGSLAIGGVTLEGGDDASFALKLDPSGAVLWAKAFQGAQVHGATMSPEGAAFLTGENVDDADFGGGPLTGAGFVVALDEAGQHVWSEGFEDLIEGYRIVRSDAGDLFVSARGIDDAVIVRLDAQGHRGCSTSGVPTHSRLSTLIAVNALGDAMELASPLDTEDITPTVTLFTQPH